MLPTLTDRPQFASIDTAAAIVVIATRIAAGFPFQMIWRDQDGGVRVALARDDLPRWLIEFDIPAPEWFPFGSYMHARWPDHAFDHLPVRFRLSCTYGPIEDEA